MAVLVNWMAEARRLESSGDVQGAVGIYRKALVRQEETAGFADLSVHNGLGDLYLRAGEVPDALKAYERAAEQCEQQQLYANGIALCKKILRKAPEHLPAFRRVARLSALSGLEAEARLHYARYRDGLARSGRESEALECLREIVDATADEESTLALVDALVGRGHRERALEILREVKQRREADGRGIAFVVRRIQELRQPIPTVETDWEEWEDPSEDERCKPAEPVAGEHAGTREWEKRIEAGKTPPRQLEAPAAQVGAPDPEVDAVAPSPTSEDVAPLLSELRVVLAEVEGSARLEQALLLIEQVLELRPGNFELLSRKLHYAYVSGNEAAAISAYLELGESLDRGLEGFNVRALSTVAVDGRVTAVVRVEDTPGQAPGS